MDKDFDMRNSFKEVINDLRELRCLVKHSNEMEIDITYILNKFDKLDSILIDMASSYEKPVIRL